MNRERGKWNLYVESGIFTELWASLPAIRNQKIFGALDKEGYAQAEIYSIHLVPAYTSSYTDNYDRQIARLGLHKIMVTFCSSH